MSVRAARLAAAFVLLALVAALGGSEWLALRERSFANVGPVDLDVAPARDALAARILEIEDQCASFASDALERAVGIPDRVDLFTELDELVLPPGVGVHLEDARGRLIAWAGSTLPDDQIERLRSGGDGGMLIETLTARRIAVRRTRDDPMLGRPVAAVCHWPIELRYPPRVSFLRSWSIEEQVSEEYRIGAARVRGPDDAGGVLLPSAFEGDLVRLDVKPLSLASWQEQIDDDARTRRLRLIAALATVVLVLVWRGATNLLPQRAPAFAAHALRAVTVIAARLALGSAALADVFGNGRLTDPVAYSGMLPGRLGDSPAALLLTCLAALLVALNIRSAARASHAPRLPLPAAIGVLLAVCLAARVALGAMVTDAVTASTVEFFAVERVLPFPASAALLGALISSALAIILLVEAAWRLAIHRTLHGTRARLAVIAVAALLLTPTGPFAAPWRPELVVLALAGIATALAIAVLSRGAATRAAVIPVALALGLFGPLQRELEAAQRLEAEQTVAESVSGSGPSEERSVLLAETVLDHALDSSALQSALSAGEFEPDLAARLWSESALAETAAGSGLELEWLLEPVSRHSFSVDLPPRTWLPSLNDPPDVRTPWVVTRPGRRLGENGRWVIGHQPLFTNGVFVATLRVWVEHRAPSVMRLPAFERSDARRPPDDRQRDLPPLDVYDGAGNLLETGSALRAAGPQLPASARAAVIGRGEPAWLEVTVGDEPFDVLLAPQVDEGVVERVHAVAFPAGARQILQRVTKAALCGALLSLVALLASSPWWVGGARLRLSYRLVASYVVVAALPLLVLAYVNRELVHTRQGEQRRRELRDAVSVLASQLHQTTIPERLAARDGDTPGPAGTATSELKETAYHPGRRENLFIGDRLVAGTDQGLYDTELLPWRLPGHAYRETVLLGHPFFVDETRIGDLTVEVGYAPLLRPDGKVIGAVSVPLVESNDRRQSEETEAFTAVLGLYLLSLGVAVLVGTVLAARLTAPLRALRLATRRVATGDLSEPVPGSGTDELGQVVDAFNVMTDELAESRERLVRAEKEAAWRDMARQVAHEVKNPLTPMRLAAEHLRRAHEDKSPNFDRVLARAVDVIVRQTDALKRIVTDFRDFARMPVQRRDPVDVGPLVQEVLELYAGVPGINVTVDVTPGLPPVLADPDELRRVVVNLAGNAVEALDGSEGTLAATVLPGTAHVILTLVDDGPGVPEEMLPHLFEPSFSTKTGGTGLGLAICKRAIEDLGGSIQIESAAGSGTSVTVELPIAYTHRTARKQ